MRLFFLLFLLSPALADFSIDFSQWLASYYGSDIRDVLERRDLGPTGSFGGKARRDEALDQQPVVFVHGVSDTAGEKMRQAANHFRFVVFYYKRRRQIAGLQERGALLHDLLQRRAE